LLEGEVQPREILTSQRALEGELARLRRKVESARTQRIQAERMAELHRERKSAARALEELRERARQRHTGALEVADNAALDEVAQRLARLEAERRAASTESTSRSGLPAADHPPRAS
jgi:DNA repair exonuclease SbcCD ATPase subunit